ncbi:hypothetical protein HanXRQr2_Chr02g0073931 [Helianthus annuus]|uniref:Retrovirus-related Pol polyprotein from transposon TNT 1-94-like beta-barrel domain-containing protein n=1 Tax=Helianthus annuus TaxID=4232 RepID=A0A9K3NZJ4_HELAN|nr:hypothetical protein HanXRQr2_Chr02g0073931 [Helianthus annuus]
MVEKVAQGKPTTRSWKSPVKNFPKRMVAKGFVKKSGKKGSAPVGRPRKAGIRVSNVKSSVILHQFVQVSTLTYHPYPLKVIILLTHMPGNKKVFKCFKRHFGLVTNEKRKDFSFVHGIGEVRIPLDGKDKIVPCVSYVPSLEKNVFSLEQLLHQGIESLTSGDTCLLKKMFGSRAKGFDFIENKSEVDLEQEYLNKFYDNLGVDNGHKEEKAKLQETIEDYYEKEFKKEKNKKASGEGSSGTNKKEVIYSKKIKTGFII